MRRELNSSKVRILVLCPALVLVAFLGYVSPWELPVSTSVISQQMSDCALFPASPSRYRVWSVWADRDSYLSLVDGTFTHIRPRVQPLSMTGLGW
jgi:hypothetical protein